MKTALKATVAALALVAATEVSGYASACTPGQTGVTPGCPIYNEPVTAAPKAHPTAESISVSSSPASLFGGQTPPNGFMVSLSLVTEGALCWVDDAKVANIYDGFIFGNGLQGVSSTFVTPTEYKPIGPVTVICQRASWIVARSW